MEGELSNEEENEFSPAIQNGFDTILELIKWVFHVDEKTEFTT